MIQHLTLLKCLTKIIDKAHICQSSVEVNLHVKYSYCISEA